MLLYQSKNLRRSSVRSLCLSHDRSRSASFDRQANGDLVLETTIDESRSDGLKLISFTVTTRVLRLVFANWPVATITRDKAKRHGGKGQREAVAKLCFPANKSLVSLKRRNGQQRVSMQRDASMNNKGGFRIKVASCVWMGPSPRPRSTKHKAVTISWSCHSSLPLS